MESNKLELLARDRICLFRSALVLTLTFFCMGQHLRADGKLRRVSELVRKDQSKRASKAPSKRSGNPGDSKNEQQPKGQDHSEHQDKKSTRNHRRPDSSNHHTHHLSSHRNDYRRELAPDVVFISQSSHCVDPLVIPAVPRCSIAPPPVMIEQHCRAPHQSFAYDSNIVEEIDSPMAGPITAAIETPMEQETVIENVELGGDWFETKSSRMWALFGSDFDGITIGGLGIHLQEPGGPGLESSVMTLRESSEYYRDHFWIGDVNVLFEVISRRDVRGRIGLGVNWLSDSWGAEAGFNLTAGIDLRLTERLLLSAEGDLGSLGDSDYSHGRIHLAHRFERSELMLGVDHYNIGGAKITGFFTGIQFRF